MSKTILITGASSGIGLASAQLFAGKAWNVVATMRDPGKAGALAGLPGVLVTRLDVQDTDSIDGAIAAGIARFGRIDGLLNNAGYGQYGLFESLSDRAVRQQFDVNLFGVMNTIRAILPHFRANRGGAILNVSSGAGLFTLPMISLYCASKFALEGYTESLSYELASQNIAVKLVIPHGGVTGTAFNDRAADADAGGAGAGGGDVGSGGDLADYADFVARTHAAFGRMKAASAISANEVAQLIYSALTDGSDRLRYLIGDDARGFVNARRTLSDDGYVAFMRAHFD